MPLLNVETDYTPGPSIRPAARAFWVAPICIAEPRSVRLSTFRGVVDSVATVQSLPSLVYVAKVHPIPNWKGGVDSERRDLACR